jgi:hypothetical protein
MVSAILPVLLSGLVFSQGSTEGIPREVRETILAEQRQRLQELEARVRSLRARAAAPATLAALLDA